MARVHVSREVVDECRSIEYIAGVIGNRVEEFEPYVMKGKDAEFGLYRSTYVVQFPGNSAVFVISQLSEVGEGDLSFAVELVANGETVWNKVYERTSLSAFDSEIARYGEGGFPHWPDKFMWHTTERGKVEMSVPDDIFVAPPQYPDEDGWGDGKDLEQFQGYEFGSNTMGGEEGDVGLSSEQVGDGSNEGDDGSSQEEEAREYEVGTGGRFMAEMFRVQPCIVPDGISQIRVVALKYEGNVIAFRFKTNVGAFDMRKSVALGYGLGSFKTETFITLRSVNGMLMSDSERKKQVCVPDVSECQEDCDKLMKALFGN